MVSITETKSGAAGSITDLTTHLYDTFDRAVQTTQRGMTTVYTYDNNGNRTSVSTSNGQTGYTFDDRNRLIRANADGRTTTYTYYPDGKKDTVSYPNGASIKYTYTSANRVETIVHTANGAQISSYAYAYDDNGNRTQQTEVQNGTAETTTYAYDTQDRLASFTVTDGTTTTETSYTFEGYNRKTEIVKEDGLTVKNITYAYDETNWLMTASDATNGSTIAFTYDNNGNTLTKSDSSLITETTAFIYDSRDQLVQATRGPPENQTILGQYDYNADGMRVRHRYSERGDVAYFYDASAVLEEHNLSDDSLLAHYRYADRLISLDTGAGIQYYHTDALGSTVNLTTDTGAVQVSYKLDPWGQIRNQQGASVNRQLYTSQELDENTGLVYFGARYYDPETARFITQDPYLGEIGTPVHPQKPSQSKINELWF